MNKKTLFVLLLIVGVSAIAGVVLFTLRNPLGTKAPVSNPTPQPLPVSIPVVTAPVATPTTPKTKPAPVAGSAAEQERQARERLFQRARDLVSRLGTYSNTDQFAAITAVYGDVTPEVKTYLETQRAAWQQAHPGTRGWGQTTRGLTAAVTQEQPILNATTAEVIVEAQQQTDDAGTKSTRLIRARIQLVKQGNEWIVSHLTWEEMGS